MSSEQILSYLGDISELGCVIWDFKPAPLVSRSSDLAYYELPTKCLGNQSQNPEATRDKYIPFRLEPVRQISWF